MVIAKSVGLLPMNSLLPQEPAWVSLKVTAPQLKVLYLAVAYGGVDGRYVQLTLNMSPSTLTRVADHLVDAGLVSRQTDAHDRRVVCYMPTEAGRELVMGLLPP